MDRVELVDPRPSWADDFEEERKALVEALSGVDLLAVEHFGSTSIPGMPAKPVIDILIAVRNIDDARAQFVVPLTKLGYSFWADNPKVDRLFFVKGLPPSAERRTHHVHVAERPSEMWDRLLFRDFLKEHTEEAGRYARLKRELAQRFPEDREAYTRGKDEYVQRVMQDARRWRSANSS